MKLRRAESQLTKRGPADYFTGTVWIDEITTGGEISPTKIVRVAFEPGARTAWHTHPHGQMLHILSGLGRVQRAGERAITVHPGDTVWFEPGERHWHGAAPETAMTHLAVQQADALGSAATWFEPVGDADYLQSGS
ncbi:(R)-mandelonitrile lyase [Horticoccus sp. 23ND18S-11]|uniref:(R)-mandelonitrile lyase n=1 Tax=Horticoccus sp. 23ND18S-11 TaxID=3391832 RepID=UPI0039C9564F